MHSRIGQSRSEAETVSEYSSERLDAGFFGGSSRTLFRLTSGTLPFVRTVRPVVSSSYTPDDSRRWTSASG